MARSKHFAVTSFDTRKTFDLPFVQSLLQRTARNQTGLFWAEGLRNLHHAIESGRSVECVVLCKSLLDNHRAELAVRHLRKSNPPILEIEADEFRSISTLEVQRGVGVVVRQQWQPLIETDIGEQDIWIVLDNARTPGNLGTILRTSAAVSAKGVMLIGGESDPHDPAAVRSSMGAIFSQRLIRTSAKALEGWRKRHRCRVIGTSPSARIHYRNADYRGPLLLLMGGERQGLRERQLRLCDNIVKLPMTDKVDSLNLAVATGVMLYEALAQRSAR